MFRLRDIAGVSVAVSIIYTVQAYQGRQELHPNACVYTPLPHYPPMLFKFRRKEVPWEVVGSKAIEPVPTYYDEDKGVHSPMALAMALQCIGRRRYRSRRRCGHVWHICFPCRAVDQRCGPSKCRRVRTSATPASSE